MTTRMWFGSGIVLWIVGLTVSLYKAFVLQNLWNWFAAIAFNVPSASFWVVLGLLWLVQLLTDRPDFPLEPKWKYLFTVLDACVPEDKKEILKEELEQVGPLWVDAGLMVLGELAQNTFVLVLGWCVHTFLV